MKSLGHNEILQEGLRAGRGVSLQLYSLPCSCCSSMYLSVPGVGFFRIAFAMLLLCACVCVCLFGFMCDLHLLYVMLCFCYLYVVCVLLRLV